MVDFFFYNTNRAKLATLFVIAPTLHKILGKNRTLRNIVLYILKGLLAIKFMTL